MTWSFPSEITLDTPGPEEHILRSEDGSAPIEIRYAVDPIETDLDQRMIRGRIMRYGDVAHIGTIEERFAPGAVQNLQDDEVLLKRMHDRDAPIARNGVDMEITDDPTEMRISVLVPPTAIGDDALAQVRAQLLRGFSIEFAATQERWDGRQRTIERATLLGVGLVDKPAYPSSQIELRAAMLAQKPGPRKLVRWW